MTKTNRVYFINVPELSTKVPTEHGLIIQAKKVLRDLGISYKGCTLMTPVVYVEDGEVHLVCDDTLEVYPNHCFDCQYNHQGACLYVDALDYTNQLYDCPSGYLNKCVNNHCRNCEHSETDGIEYYCIYNN